MLLACYKQATGTLCFMLNLYRRTYLLASLSFQKTHSKRDHDASYNSIEGQMWDQKARNLERSQATPSPVVLYHDFVLALEKLVVRPVSTLLLSLGSSPMPERVDEDKVVNLACLHASRTCALEWTVRPPSACAMRIVRKASCAGCGRKNERGFRLEDIPSVWRAEKVEEEDEEVSVLSDNDDEEEVRSLAVSPLCISLTS